MLKTAVERAIPATNAPRGQSPMDLLTPRELSQTTKVRPPTTAGRVTIPDPSDTLEQTVRKLIETAGRLVADRSAPGSGLTAPYGTIDDTGRVEFSQETMKCHVANEDLGQKNKRDADENSVPSV